MSEQILLKLKEIFSNDEALLREFITKNGNGFIISNLIKSWEAFIGDKLKEELKNQEIKSASVSQINETEENLNSSHTETEKALPEEILEEKEHENAESQPDENIIYPTDEKQQTVQLESSELKTEMSSVLPPEQVFLKPEKPEGKITESFKFNLNKKDISILPANLPNATQNKEYYFDVSGDVLGAIFKPECGLEWDNETKIIKGIPNYSGDIEIIWELPANSQQIKFSKLYINEDPQSLWKNIPSNPEALFYKSDNHHEYIESEQAQLIGARVRGRSHAHVGSFCDDDFVIQYFTEQNLYLLAVSDGAGSAEYSRYGSKLVVQAVKNTIEHELKSAFSDIQNANEDKIGIELYNLIQKSALQAYKALYDVIIQDSEKSENEKIGLSLKKLYCTLLIALVMPLNKNTWIVGSYSIGDGAIAFYELEKRFLELMNLGDSGQYSGETQFLTNQFVTNEELEKRIKIRPMNQDGILFLMTDGVSDPKFESDRAMNHPIKWEALLNELKEPLKSENPAQQLEQWLQFWSAGNHDDRTLALFIPKGLIHE